MAERREPTIDEFLLFMEIDQKKMQRISKLETILQNVRHMTHHGTLENIRNYIDIEMDWLAGETKSVGQVVDDFLRPECLGTEQKAITRAV